MAQLGVEQLAAIYEAAVRDLNAMELRVFFLTEATWWRDLMLPDDLTGVVQEHITAAAALLKNMTALPGRKRRRNMIRDVLS